MMSRYKDYIKNIPLIANILIGILIVAACLLVGIAWYYDSTAYENTIAGNANFRLATWAALLMSGISLILSQSEYRIPRFLSILFSAVIILSGIVGLAGIIYGLIPGTDIFFLREAFSKANTSSSGMSLSEALCVVIIGILLIQLSFKHIKFNYFHEFCIVTVVSISVLGLLGSAFGLAHYNEIAAFSNISILAALLFLLLCIGIILTFYHKTAFRLSLNHRLYAGFFFITTLLISVSYLAGSGYTFLHQTTRREAHSQNIKNYLNLLQSDILDIETNVRGYLLSKDEDFVASMNKTKEDLHISVKELTPLLSDNGEQLLRLDTLNRIINERIGMAESLKSVIQSEGKQAGMSLFLTMDGQLLTNRIRHLIFLMKENENSLLEIRNSDEIRYTQRLRSIVYLNLVIDIILIAIIYIVIRKNINQKNTTILEVRRLNEELEAKVEDRTHSLALSEEKYRNMFARNPQPMWIYEIETLGFMEVNEAALSHYGYSRDEFMSMTLRDIYPSEEIPEMLRAIEQRRNSYYFAGERRHLKKNGEIITVEIISYTIRFNDRDARHVMVTDITARKLAEDEIQKLKTELETKVLERTSQLESANSELESFSYSVSHDLRAPLRHINGFVDILTREYYDQLPEQAQHYLRTITASAQKMGTLIDDLLRLSRTGRVELKKTRVNMGKILDDVLSQCRPSFENRNIEWDISPLPDVKGDYNLLHLVWMNLVDNALKYTRQTEKTVIRIGYDQVKMETIFHISDNGVGFDMNYAQKLFGVFQRFHSSTQFEGTGVGLATVQRIILRHGGRIWAYSEPDKGAAFYFSIPISKEEKL